LRRLGEGILTKFGYSVLSASNGREALRIYSRERDRISLIILDLIMPEMGGRECLHEIKQIDPSARVLITSGYAANNQIALALEEGAHDAIEKPYDVKQMLDAVRKALDE
jgi:DNA-binding NtrC family response regulator